MICSGHILISLNCNELKHINKLSHQRRFFIIKVLLLHYQ